MNKVTLVPQDAASFTACAEWPKKGTATKPPSLLQVVLNSDTMRQHLKPQAGELVSSLKLPLFLTSEAERVLE